MNPLASLSLNFSAQPIAGRVFATESPIGQLYAASISTPSSHFEGAQALAALHSYLQELEASGIPRLTPASYNVRLQSAMAFAGSVFSAIPEVEAIAFYGSALRGKLNPRDFDARLVTAYMEPDHTEFMYPVMNKIQERVDSAYKTNASIPKMVDGLPVQVLINCAFADISGMELDYIQGGPYLAVLRPEAMSTSFHQAYPIFLNTSGKQYLKERAA